MVLNAQQAMLLLGRDGLATSLEGLSLTQQSLLPSQQDLLDLGRLYGKMVSLHALI